MFREVSETEWPLLELGLAAEKIVFGWQLVGPGLAASKADWLVRGQLAGLKLTAGGSGFRAGLQLTCPTLVPWKTC